jgi:hypothetical protein
MILRDALWEAGPDLDSVEVDPDSIEVDPDSGSQKR